MIIILLLIVVVILGALTGIAVILDRINNTIAGKNHLKALELQLKIVELKQQSGIAHNDHTKLRDIKCELELL